MSEKRERAERKGREAEAQAAQWLMQQGWRVIAERVRTPRGEIDLVARKGHLLGFFEVKWRTRSADLADAIDERRLRRVAAAAEIVSWSRISPTRITSGSIRKARRNASGKSGTSTPISR